MSFLSTAVQQTLEQAPFCAIATVTARGPHCTPLVFAYSGGRIWLTTSRGSVKARAWREDPTTAGLARLGELSVTFTGTVRLYDALDRRTWGDAVAGATSIARATAMFSRKNARFFAGYAVDARQVPFAWTPPGRVFVGVDIDRTALLDEDGVQEGRGRWGGEVASRGSFRRTTTGDDPFAAVPRDIREELGEEGHGSLTVVGERGPVVLPARWRAEPHALYAALPSETLALADAGAEPDVALTVDVASEWRARDMAGAMLRGIGSCYVDGRVGSGAKTLRALAASIDPAADTVIRVAPRRAVWWQGWSSGSAELA